MSIALFLLFILTSVILLLCEIYFMLFFYVVDIAKILKCWILLKKLTLLVWRNFMMLYHISWQLGIILVGMTKIFMLFFHN